MSVVCVHLTFDHVIPYAPLFKEAPFRAGSLANSRLLTMGGVTVVIFFGAPKPMGEREQALRAVRMAIEMQARMVTLRERWLADGVARLFHIRIGINTGRASIGNFGSPERADYTAIGRQVNLAARLQARCAPDRILISHATWVLVRDAIDCEPKGEITVKGIRDPVTVYEVIGPRCREELGRETSEHTLIPPG